MVETRGAFDAHGRDHDDHHSAVAEGGPVGLLDGVIESFESSHEGDGSEGLFVHHARFERHIGQHRGAKEKAGVVGTAAALSARGYAGACLHRVAHVAFDGVGPPGDVQ